MATSLAGRMYEMVLQRKHQHGATCMGPDCFRYTFLIVAALSLIVTLLAVILWLRTRSMYATIIQVTLHSCEPLLHRNDYLRRMTVFCDTKFFDRALY